MLQYIYKKVKERAAAYTIMKSAETALRAERKDTMYEIFEMLKSAGAYFIATCDEAQPRVRPFGTVNLYKDRIYIQTGKSKAVSHQLHKNPKLEICTMVGRDWLRIEASAVEDDDREARVSMLEAYPELKAMYSPDDGNTEVWYLRNVSATLYSFSQPPKTYKF